MSGRKAKPRPLRVLVLSHSHPRITNGGAEIAAYRLFTELAGEAGVEAWFLGCDTGAGGGRDGVALTQPFTDAEYVYHPNGQFDWLRFSNADPRLPGELRALLQELRPDVVHLHHYVNFGVEALLTIRKVLPSARIIVTLHEYLAICHHFGQMVKRGQFSLCDASGLGACNRCFPDISPSDFFIRNQYIKLFFNQVDCFVCPSDFLLQRYRDWGVEPERLKKIDNLIAETTTPPSAETGAEVPDGPLRIGFFGQISKLKGIGVIFDCAQILAEQPSLRITIDIFGDYRGQPPEFQAEFLELLAKRGHNVNFRGPYRQPQVDRLMRSVDAVLVPSIWWENAPVVIEEALRNRRPVICSDIGGMAEKVRDGLDGFHFSVGSGFELSFLLTKLYQDRDLLRAIEKTARRPTAAREVLEDHLRIYRGEEERQVSRRRVRAD
jgi:glycosyltransferase involved in cell wall biosynthesis